MPPAAGPARTRWCVDHGLESLTDATRNYGIALREIMVHLPGGPSDLPPPYPLHLVHTEELALKVGRRRVTAWFKLHNRLDRLDRDTRRKGGVLLDARWHLAEKMSYASLQSAADAFNWLDDACLDLGSEVLVDVSSFVNRPVTPRPVDELVDAAHATAHAAGELFGGLFGCKMVYEDGRWFDQCIVGLLHLRFGNSAGLRIRFRCTICETDPADCEHELGKSYTIYAARTVDGECTVCQERDCSEHVPGSPYSVIAKANPADPRLREVSLTPRPRDPLTRITSRSIDNKHLLKNLGRIPEQGEVVLDHACMYPCTGFRRMKDTEG